MVDAIEITTEKNKRDTSTTFFFYDESSNLKSVADKINTKGDVVESLDTFKFKDPTVLMNKKEGKIVTINGRKAVIKKRKGEEDLKPI